MSSIKLAGLLAVVAAASMAFPGFVSATAITSSTGSTPTMSMESGNLELLGPFTTIKCGKSTLHGSIQSHGAGIAASGKFNSMTFTECNYPFTTISPGSFAIHGTSTTGNGTVTWSGTVIEIHTSVGVCRIETAATHIGTLTSAEHATLDIPSAPVPYNGTSFFCGGSGTWKGTYKVTHPTSLQVH